MFAHLHAHSHFSFKDATISPAQLSARAKALGMSAVALTDHNTLAGAIRFYRACLNDDVKPIIGCEISLETGQHLVLLAMNLSGYSNLCRLLSKMHLTNQNQTIKASLDMVEAHGQHLICLTACSHSKVVTRADLLTLSRIFPTRLYVELESEGTRESQRTVRHLVNVANELQLPLVATNNVHYLDATDHYYRNTLVAMGENVSISQSKVPGDQNGERYFKSAAEMIALFRDYPEAIENVNYIVKQCSLQLPLGRYRFPYFPLPDDATDHFVYLEKICHDNLLSHYPASNLPLKRLEHELNIIRTLGFVEYFLVVWDIVAFARREKIRYSGRGSVGGSLVAYLLGITGVDPMAYNLIFERFLNPERRGMPDIDLDFDSSRRDEVIAHITQRYGDARSALLGTVNTFNARSALREVAKALSFSTDEINQLSAFMPYTSANRMEKAIETLPELHRFPKGPRFSHLLNICRALDGAPRHLSVHLGGVVISREPLTDLVPLQWSAKGVIITQYDKDDIEALGLVKIDLLGLRTLSAIEYTINSLAGKGLELDTSKLPLDDERTYSLLCSTQSVGVFQLESPGLRELLGRLQPTTFNDVIAATALFRPGPMQADMVSPFIARRHQKEETTYSHESLRPILEDTYGVIVYQEQVLQVAAELAGFTLGQGDLLRRAMTKGCSKAEMETIRESFLLGCSKRSIDAKNAEKAFKQLAAFAAYGFNKGHAVNFALLSYQTAYLKAHFPAHFFAGVLNNQPMGFYPPGVILHEARLRNVSILPPDIQRSAYDFTADGSDLRVGLRCIPSFTLSHYSALEASKAARELISLPDFLTSLPYSQQLWETLFKAGALDSLGTRQNLAKMLGFNAHSTFSMKERLRGELDATGLAYTMHPMCLYERHYQSLGITTSENLRKLSPGARVKVAGLIIARQTPPTRSKQRVIFLTVEDSTGLIDVAVFADAQRKYAACALKEPLLYIEGTLRYTSEHAFSITAEKVLDLRKVVTASAKGTNYVI